MTIMLAEPETARDGFRWSSARDCPRKAVYEVQGAPARERDRAEEGYLWRGQQLGRDFAIILAAEERRKGLPYKIKVASGVVGDWPRRWVSPDLDEAAFVVEEQVPWPFGIMHPDIHVVADDTLVEVLSSAHASEAHVGSKMVQLVGQMHYSGAAAGAVVVVNPTNPLDYDTHPITRTSKRYAELVDEVLDRVEAIAEWHETGALPERVCGKPRDARAHFCLHGEHCFAGWSPPDPDVVLDTDDARAAAVAYYESKQAERVQKELYDRARGERMECEQRVAELLDDDAKVARIGALEVRRTGRADSESLSLKKARTAGVWTGAHDEAFAEFLKWGGGWSGLQVDRVGEEPLDDGGVPF